MSTSPVQEIGLAESGPAARTGAGEYGFEARQDIDRASPSAQEEEGDHTEPARAEEVEVVPEAGGERDRRLYRDRGCQWEEDF